MRTFLLALLLWNTGAAAFPFGSALSSANIQSARKAQASYACYNVSDADARTYCLARANNEPAQCYSIQRADLRSQCLAEVRR